MCGIRCRNTTWDLNVLFLTAEHIPLADELKREAFETLLYALFLNITFGARQIDELIR